MKDYLHTICTVLAKIVQNCTKIDKINAEISRKSLVKRKDIANLND